ncbi:ankyrin repeat domain-containing protein [Cognatiluteimonas lumbrici]|uniref:ankyrin repeat domain-containing protein n=1 Tax=Cognatiluteimonas lumbrici TaxID=2559601 RepID=UPI0011276C89|nr:ankyrin repeat domain-containing protein [Luteimonas lumbrici]
MPEARKAPGWPAAALLAAGALLVLAAGFGGIAAAAAVPAQVAFALAPLHWRRPWRGLLDDWRGPLELLCLWAGSALLFALLMAWPLSALLQGGSLGAAFASSLVFGLALLAAWRAWPLWQGVERDGGGLAAHWRALAGLDVGDWRGLGAALAVTALAALPLLLGWEALLPEGARWGVAVAGALLSPLLHWQLRRIPPAPALPLPVQVMADDAEDTEVDAAAGMLLEDGQDPVAALYEAARTGRVERALALLEAGADPKVPPPPGDRDQRSLPVLAAVLPDLRLLRALIARGVDLGAAHAGLTPLLAATRDSWHGRPEAVMTLLANGADPRARDQDGNTPLHHAARSSDPGVAALLRDAAAELEAINDEGLTPLGVACAAGNWRLARFLLERGAKPEAEGATPALLAAAASDEDEAAGVQLLLKHKAKVDARDARGRTALHEAAIAGNIEVARALLERGADTAAVDEEGLRAVDHAAQARRWPLVALLDPSYPLPVAGATDALDGEAGDGQDGAAPEEAAADEPDPREALREALRAGRFEHGNAVLARLLSPAELGELLLDEDAQPSVERIRWLLDRSADPEARVHGGHNAMTALLERGPDAAPAIRLLLDRAVPPSGPGGLARFMDACLRGDPAARMLEPMALELLDRGADPLGASPTGDPVLALAVRLGWMRLAARLLAAGADHGARDSHGMTALHLAAALGREPAVRLLVLHGASPEVRAADGQTPLGVALSSGRRDIVEWLEWRGWRLPGRALQATDLPAAAIVGDAGAVRKLVDFGFDVDTPDAQGCTALLRAAGGGHRAVVELLLERKADPQRAAHTGATPLSAAVSMRQGDIVERLLQAGAGLEQRLPGDVTVLMLAAALGLPDLCARLLQAGANVHATDAQGLTPLHCAVLFGFTARERPRLLALLDTLLLAGADADASAAGGVSPLLLLLGARAEPGTACDEEVLLTALERLLDEEVALDVQDPRGFGPLHLAALHGLLRVTQRLLRAGCNPDLRDNLNRSPREIAVMRGFVDVAAEYAPGSTGVSMARFLREPR